MSEKRFKGIPRIKNPFPGVELRARWCPQCSKQRLYKPLSEEVSYDKEEFETRDKSKVTLFTDLCEFCRIKNYKKYFKPTKTDAKKVIEAMEKGSEDGASLEEML
jgi:hypothetical protein